MSVMETALRKAGYVPTDERLRNIAVEVLGLHGANREARRDALYARVLNDAELLCQLFAPFRHQALDRYLREVEEELSREAAQQAAREGGRRRSGDPTTIAPIARTPKSGGEAGLTTSDTQHARNPTLAAALLARETARRTVMREAQAEVGQVLRLSRLETFRIDGRPLGECSVGMARGWASARGHEARWILQMTANMPADFLVGRYVTADEADAAWRRARDDGE